MNTWLQKKPILSLGYKEGSLKDLIEKTNVGYHISNVDDAKKLFMSITQNIIIMN